MGMAKLSTHSRSNAGYVFRRQGGEEYRSNACPNLTLTDVGVREGDTVEFLGDFEPFVPPSDAAKTAKTKSSVDAEAGSCGLIPGPEVRSISCDYKCDILKQSRGTLRALVPCRA